MAGARQPRRGRVHHRCGTPAVHSVERGVSAPFAPSRTLLGAGRLRAPAARVPGSFAQQLDLLRGVATRRRTGLGNMRKPWSHVLPRMQRCCTVQGSARARCWAVLSRVLRRGVASCPQCVGNQRLLGPARTAAPIDGAPRVAGTAEALSAHASSGKRMRPRSPLPSSLRRCRFLSDLGHWRR